jgi:putative endonuclease
VGRSGERRVARWYLDRGYTIVARNWRVKEGELDVVARVDRTLVICEVKTRSSERYGTGFEAVTWSKQSQIRRVTLHYLQDLRGWHPAEIRFDVASVTPSTIEVIEAAF